MYLDVHYETMCCSSRRNKQRRGTRSLYDSDDHGAGKLTLAIPHHYPSMIVAGVIHHSELAVEDFNAVDVILDLSSARI